MKKPFIQGVPKYIDTDQPVDAMLRSTGGNTGNLLFSTALQNIVAYPRVARGFRIETMNTDTCDIGFVATKISDCPGWISETVTKPL